MHTYGLESPQSISMSNYAISAISFDSNTPNILPKTAKLNFNADKSTEYIKPPFSFLTFLVIDVLDRQLH